MVRGDNVGSFSGAVIQGSTVYPFTEQKFGLGQDRRALESGEPRICGTLVRLLHN